MRTIVPIIGLVTAMTLMVPACAAQPRNDTHPPDAPERNDQRNSAAEAANRVAIDLYAQLRTKEGNLFFSPLSLSAALAMTHAGARGETAKEMANALHLSAMGADDANPQAVARAYASLIRSLHGEDAEQAGYRLSLASALWGQQGYPYVPGFIALLEEHYGAGLHEIDFTQVEPARAAINQWVSKHTQDRIEELIPAGALDPDVRLVLTNAIYFKGDWLDAFDKEQTRQQPFTVAPGRTVQAQMMHRSGSYRYAKDDQLQILEMPYKGEQLSMIILLPESPDGLAALERSLSAENWDRWLRMLRPTEVELSLPKFILTRQLDLAQELGEMGMSRAFDPERADFSGIATVERLYVSAVIHKAFVDVNEEGTEAAAASGVVVRTRMAPQTTLFRADHPFVFAIRHNASGAILFLGRLNNPGE